MLAIVVAKSVLAILVAKSVLAITRVPTIFCISLCFGYVIELLMLFSKMVLVFHLIKQTKTKTRFFIWHFLAVPSPSWRKVDNLVAIGRGLPIVLRACEFDSFSMSVKSWSIADLVLLQQRLVATQANKVHKNQVFLNFDKRKSIFIISSFSTT